MITKINYRQTCILVFLSQIALKFLALPSLMYLESGNESIFIALVMMLVDGLYAFLLLTLARKSGEKNIYEFMCSCLGKVVTKIILVVLLLKYAMVVANISKGLEFFVVDNLYTEFKWHYYVLPLVAVVGFMIYKGINNLGRVGEIVCWLIIVGIVYIALKSFSSADAESFLPLFENGVKPLCNCSFKYMSWFGSSTFILMLFGKIDFSRRKPWQMIRYIIIAIALVQLVYFVFYGIFQVTSPTHSFCLSDISQFSSVHSSIDELSWLIVSLWIVAQAVQIAIYSYCICEALKFIFNIKGETLPTLIVMIYISLLSFIGEKSIGLERIFFSPFASILSITAQYIIPMIILVAYLISSKIKKYKTQKMQKGAKPKQNKKLAEKRRVG